MPSRLAEVLLRHRRGEVSDALARAALTLCVDCGACASFCHHGEPLPAALRAARAAIGLTPAPRPLPTDMGATNATVVIETDARAWGEAWGERHGEPVVRLPSPDALSRDAAGHAGWEAHLVAVRRWIGGRPVVLADARVATVLQEAGVAASWLAGAAPAELPGRIAEAGAFGPFVGGAPEDARRLAARWWEERGRPVYVADVGSANHLRALLGVAVMDVVDRWLAGQETP